MIRCLLIMALSIWCVLLRISILICLWPLTLRSTISICLAIRLRIYHQLATMEISGVFRDSVANIWDRKLKYNATSTGGASGAPVWYYDPGAEEERRLIAVNTTHWTSCDGGGSRLVWNNEDLITNTWLRWEPLNEREDGRGLCI